MQLHMLLPPRAIVGALDDASIPETKFAVKESQTRRPPGHFEYKRVSYMPSGLLDFWASGLYF